MLKRNFAVIIIFVNIVLLSILIFLVNLVIGNAQNQPDLPASQVELVAEPTLNQSAGIETSKAEQIQGTETPTAEQTVETQPPAETEPPASDTPGTALIPIPTLTPTVFAAPARPLVPPRIELGGPTKAPYVFPTPVFIPTVGAPRLPTPVYIPTIGAPRLPTPPILPR